MQMDSRPVILPFFGGNHCPVQYWTDWEGHDYYVRFKNGFLSVDRDSEEVFEASIGESSEWGDEETTLYLGLISEAIQTDGFDRLHVPVEHEAPRHPWYQLGPLPKRPVGFGCGLQTPLGIPLPETRDWTEDKRLPNIHYHTFDCVEWVGAGEFGQWQAAHPGGREEYLRYEAEKNSQRRKWWLKHRMLRDIFVELPLGCCWLGWNVLTSLIGRNQRARPKDGS
jgi:hypothetical protein